VVRNNNFNNYQIIDYDYSKYTKSDLTEIKNQVLLLIWNRSGSNNGCFFYMIKNHIDDRRLNFIEQYDNDNNESFYLNIIKSKIIIVERDYLVLPKNKIVIQFWHGFGPKGCGYTNALWSDQDDKNETAHQRWLRFNAICSYGGMYNTVIGACFGLPQNKFYITGMPRNDVLLLSDGKKNLNKLFPESAGKIIVMYMPTFRQYPRGEMSGREEGYLYNYSDFNWDVFDEYCYKQNIFFIIKQHALEKEKTIFDRLRNIKIFPNPKLDESDFYHYLNGADILMTDYSSVYIDFLLLERPVFFCVGDEKEYGDERGYLLTPLDFWQPGPRIRSVNDFIAQMDAINNNDDKYIDERKRIKRLTHKYADSGSSQRVIRMILSLLDNRRSNEK